MGTTLSIDDAVRISNRHSSYYNQNGIVKSIYKNIVFLWDRQFMTQSNGIFVENPKNTTLLGADLLKGVEDNNYGKRQMANTNKI